MKKVFIDDCPNGVMRNHEWADGVCAQCGGQLPSREEQFSQRLERLLNAHSQENPSNTPDFILCHYLLGCLAAWNQGVQQRETWYGRDPRPGCLDSANNPAVPTTHGGDA